MSAKQAKKMRKMLNLKETQKEDLRAVRRLVGRDAEGKPQYSRNFSVVDIDPAKRKYKEVKKILKNKDLYDYTMSKQAEQVEKENE
jgi:phenylacetate-coenzyme A ligase PaaK-like adenylate-forming protein